MGQRRLRVEPLEDRRLLAVVINEFHTNPDNPTEQVEFIELHNTGASAVDLSGWRLNEAVDFTFAPGSSLAAGGYLVVTQNAADFQAKFGFAPFGEWEAGDKLSNEGEEIELLDAAGEEVDELTYELGFPWPTTGDYGSSLELVNPQFDNSLGGNWRTSGLTGDVADPTLIATSSVWRYRKGLTANPPTVAGNAAQNWRLTGFNEANDPVAWQNGTTSIGYGQSNTTVLSDMQNNYTSIYLRKEFTITGSIPDTLKLRLNVDDGAIIWINGTELPRFHVTSGNKNYNDVSGEIHNPAWEEVTLNNTSSYLVAGTNTIAVHVLNQSAGSSDLNFILELSRPGSTAGPPTPGAQNSVFAANTAPQMRELAQSIQQPTSGQDVVISMRVTDPDGVQEVKLDYQLVNPGSYIRLTDAAYQTSWTTLVMHDDGLNGDGSAGDGVYSVVLPGSLQTNRRLVRYRVTAKDTLGATIRAPYADDAQPNFAYFVYDGIPGWTGANQPGVTATVNFGTNVTRGIDAYHLIANSTDVTNSQYVSSYENTEFVGTFVYDGVVYDHVNFQIRGEYSTYVSGKNKWKISFNTGHELAARDNYGNLYAEKWKRLNLNANASPWISTNRGMAGLDEAVSFRLYQMAGVDAPNTNYVQLRVIDAAAEAPADQYGGDLWGLYLAVENVGGRYLNEHGLEDGNVYQIEAGNGDSTNQSPDQPTDASDWNAFRAQAESGTAPLSWWQANLNLEQFTSFEAITRAVSNVDLRGGDNYSAYHAPDGLWQMIPWDLDMMYIPETHQSGSTPYTTYASNARRVAEIALEVRNRSRELLDLLFSDGSKTGGQVGQVVEEFARMVNASNGAGGYQTGWAELDQYLWNYNPLTTNDHRGQFYANPSSESMFGGTYTRNLATANFAGMVQWIINFMTDTDPNSWSIGDGDQRGYGFNYLEYEAADSAIPFTPTISYVGEAGYPLDQLQFSTSAFSDPNGSAFGKMEWRVAEVSNPNTPDFDPNSPWKYEVDAIWESGELTTYGSGITVPGGAIEAGHTYRTRVRMQDATGRWSHWSAPVEFVATAPAAVPAIRIVEFNYHPAANPNVVDEEDMEFIEIQNVGTEAVDMSGVQIADIASTPYVFAGGTNLAAGERIVVARNPSVLESVYGTIGNLMPTGYGTANLSNGGETIRLLTAGGVEIQKITYTDDAPWPTSAVDGGGYTLTIVDPLGDSSDGANWQASGVLGGTPGMAEQTFLPGDFDQDGDVDGRDFLAWQRGQSTTPLSSGDLTDWQTNYGSEALAGVSSPLLAEVVTFTTDPGNAIPGLWLFDEEREAVSTAEHVFDEHYVEEVDRALETISTVTPTPFRGWGEMVARRHFAKPQIRSTR